MKSNLNNLKFRVFDLFVDELGLKLESISTPELKIVLQKKDQKFVNDVLNMIHLFDIE